MILPAILPHFWGREGRKHKKTAADLAVVWAHPPAERPGQGAVSTGAGGRQYN